MARRSPKAFWCLQRFTTTSGGAALDADDVIDLFHTYPVDLRQPGHLGDAARDDRQHPQAEGHRHGQLLWTESLQPGNPPRSWAGR